VLRDLSLWDKRNDRIMTLSGGMKRRVMIAKALAHEPTLLFLDEPTAGVDVALRKRHVGAVRELRDTSGVTIILTTHYIEEAEQMADRIGVINKGELVLVEDKTTLMTKLGKRQLTLHLQEPVTAIPEGLSQWPLELAADGTQLEYTFDANERRQRRARADCGAWPSSASGSRHRHPPELARGHLRRAWSRVAGSSAPPQGATP
jgi:ABC-2 type transport system ATP-binding protein